MFDRKINLSGVRSLTELMDKTGLSRSSVYRLSRQPGFPGYYVGRRLIVDGDRLSEWLEQQQAGKGQGEL